MEGIENRRLARSVTGQAQRVIKATVMDPRIRGTEGAAKERRSLTTQRHHYVAFSKGFNG